MSATETKKELSQMGKLRRAFFTFCGFDLGLRDNFGDFCYAIRSQGATISKMNNISQGEKFRLNPEPNWDNPEDVYKQLDRGHRTTG